MKYLGQNDNFIIPDHPTVKYFSLKKKPSGKKSAGSTSGFGNLRSDNVHASLKKETGSKSLNGINFVIIIIIIADALRDN